MAQTTTFLFPCSYESRKSVDESHAAEFEAVSSIPKFRTALYNHDKLITDPEYHIKLYPDLEPGLCIVRTWMMKPEEYARFHFDISVAGGQVVNSVLEYNLKLKQDNIKQLDRFYAYTANGIDAVAQEWLQGGTDESPEEIAAFIEKTTNYGLSYFVNDIL